MGKDSGIQWTHHTFNPHWGCVRVSPGCERCYAETFAHRLGLKVWGAQADRREFGDKHWREPLRWNKAAEKAGERHRVFCASMADVFEDHPVAARSRERLWPLIESTPHLDWLLLTKRPENMIRFAPPQWSEAWPANVQAGCTAEDQERLQKRILWLVEVPAAIHFLSIEPQIGEINLTRIQILKPEQPNGPAAYLNALTGHVIGPDDVRPELTVQWVIVGGESGHGARPFWLTWARAIVEQCKASGTACFIKQLGSNPALAGDHGYSLAKIRSKKGGDINEWPADLRVRQFPRGK